MAFDPPLCPRAPAMGRPAREGLPAILGLLLTLLAPPGVSAQGAAPARAGSTASAPPAAATADDWLYRVQPGDTLIALSATFLKPGVGWPALQRLNQVADPYRLPPGRMLRMPLAWLRGEAAVAEVLHVHGDVQRLGPGGDAAPLAAGATLRAGDALRTGAQSSVAVRFVDGARLLVTPDSTVRLVQLLRLGPTGLAQTRLRLERGSADSAVPPATRPAGGYRIDTPAVNLGVRGTEFRVRHGDDAVSSVEVLRGLVDAAAPIGRGQSVAAGFGTQARPGAAVASVRPLLPAPDLAALPRRLERVPLQAAWQPMAGATRYRAQVFADAPGELLLLEGVFTEPLARWPDLPDGRYRMRVRALDADGLEGRDAQAEFVLKARPEPPFSREPPSGRRVYGDRVRFQWTQPAAAAGYRLQVSPREDFAELVADLPTLTDTAHELALPPGRYHWRLASVAGASDQGPFGDAQAFDLQPVPATPAADPPEQGDKGLVFRWQAGPTGRYEVEVARDAGFADIVARQATDAREFTLADPAPGIYHMRVRALADDGFAGAWGTPQQAEVSSRPWWLLVPLILILL